MQRKRLRCALAAAGALLTAVSVCRAQAPEIDIPASSIASGLTDRDKKMIEAYVKHWAGILANAENEADILKARDEVLRGYRKAAVALYQDAYAEIAANAFIPLLRQPPPRLRTLKEVNIALIFVGMPRPASQDAVDAMVASPDAGVRLLGWKAYRAIEAQALSADRSRAKLLAALRRAATGEESTVVAEDLFRVLSIPTLAAAPLPPDKLAEVRKDMLGIFRSCWLAWCKRVLAGRSDAAAGCRIGAVALWNSGEVLEGDKASKTAVLQMLADMLWCSSKAYQNAKGAAAAQGNAPLMETIERGLAALAERPAGRSLTAALNTKLPPEEKADEVRRHALDWIESLKKEGVQDPADTFQPAAAPAPATNP